MVPNDGTIWRISIDIERIEQLGRPTILTIGYLFQSLAPLPLATRLLVPAGIR